MTHWTEYSEADFDRSRAPRGATKRAADAAAAGQSGLFFVATPTVPAKSAPAEPGLPGQADLWATEPEDCSGVFDGIGTVYSDADPGL